MSDRKIIAVVGATGAQGSGLVRAILNDPDGGFSVRAITRDPNSDKARELADLGAEVVQGDVDDRASMERAFNGAHGAYLVTFFWSHFSPEKETAQARAMADAAKAAGVKHAIWSTLEDTRRWVPLDDDRMPTLQGRYKVPHFDGKGEADQHFRDIGLPTTYLMASFYWDNMIHFGMGPKRGEDGKLAITLPMGEAKLAGIAAEDIGASAYGIFNRGAEMTGRTVGIAGEQLTGHEMAARLTDALGEEVRYNAVPPAVFRSFGFPGAEDLGNMFQFYAEFADYLEGARDVALSRQLHPGLLDLRGWLARYGKRIPLDG